jgi:hypothetical protein
MTTPGLEFPLYGLINDASGVQQPAYHDGVAWHILAAAAGQQNFSVVEYGAVGDGVTDDSAAIQAAVNAIKATAIPGGTLYFPGGRNYLITTSINCTSITSQGQGIGIKMTGDSEGASRIIARLSAALPVFDFSGTGRATVRDVWVHGDPSGLQTCAFRFARASNTFGDNPYMHRVGVDGTMASLAVCVICDQWLFDECEMVNSTAPVAVGWTGTDYFNCGSAYTTLGTPSNTYGEMHSCQIGSASRSGFAGTGFAEVRFTGECYCNLAGTAQQAIEIMAGAGGKTVFADMRVESNGNTGNTSVLFVAAGQSTANGRLTGQWWLNNNGTVISFGDTTAVIQGYDIRPSAVSHQGTGTLTYFGPNGGFYYNTIFNPSGLAVGDSSHNYPSRNLIFHGAGTTWAFQGPNSPNLQMGPSSAVTLGGNLALNGNFGAFGAAPVAQQTAAGNTHTVAAGATTSVFTNTTFDGGTGVAAYTIGDIVKALKAFGLITS